MVRKTKEGVVPSAEQGETPKTERELAQMFYDVIQQLRDDMLRNPIVDESGRLLNCWADCVSGRVANATGPLDVAHNRMLPRAEDFEALWESTKSLLEQRRSYFKKQKRDGRTAPDVADAEIEAIGFDLATLEEIKAGVPLLNRVGKEGLHEKGKKGGRLGGQRAQAGPKKHKKNAKKQRAVA